MTAPFRQSAPKQEAFHGMGEAASSISRKQLRPYQASAIQALRISILQGNRRIVLATPTGGGKTLLASHIVQGALAKGGRAVFTAPMIVLIDQTVTAFRGEGIDHIGAMQANHPLTDPSAPVQVASLATLNMRFRDGDYPEASIVLVDEVHVANKFLRSWMKARPRTVFIGLTATPGRAGMAAEWDDLVVGTTTAELIEAGYLSQFSVYAASEPDLSGVKIVNGDYQSKGAAEVMGGSGLTGDIVANYLLHGEGRPTLAFASTVAHAQRMAEDFTAAGIPSNYVEAKHDTLERRVIQERFRRGEIKVIWSVLTMTTGVDLPVSGIIDAAPTRSAMLLTQKYGRGLRVNPGTEDLKIWDHAGNTLRLGFVTDMDWSSLPDGEKGNAKPREKPLPKPCKACGAIMAVGVRICPSCGEERKVPSGYVETQEGELVELTGKKSGKASAKDIPVAVKQHWYGGLLAIAREKGRKDGWAYHSYKDRFGVGPGNFERVPATPTDEMRSWVKSRAIAYAKKREAERGRANA